ncbi:hypothetical protein [Deinococcus peraridilitoris]|uniref:Uncharacterized protein n=1 Tax=Deinococcus peraridilitoris (strain DSM 19664 / LMG 22246 / CIP 109416 / KR-200) TaxID=937777 RepID=L0A359_DEIPD|nr:hypothetical protein [Deinococcus peraridilitoris]AFZ67592.1 hypothetical protein Deipe_2097 [Deinococcus peraridilitoris DSM 19664]
MEYTEPQPASRALLDELGNVCLNYPLPPGHTISHATANELVRRGWAERNRDSHFIPTREGIRRYERAERMGDL